MHRLYTILVHFLMLVYVIYMCVISLHTLYLIPIYMRVSVYVLSLIQARIVAMTCTHAALTRRRLIELDFKYDRYIYTSVYCILYIIDMYVYMYILDDDVKQLSLSYNLYW